MNIFPCGMRSAARRLRGQTTLKRSANASSWDVRPPWSETSRPHSNDLAAPRTASLRRERSEPEGWQHARQRLLPSPACGGGELPRCTRAMDSGLRRFCTRCGLCTAPSPRRGAATPAREEKVAVPALGIRCSRELRSLFETAGKAAYRFASTGQIRASPRREGQKMILPCYFPCSQGKRRPAASPLRGKSQGIVCG